MRHKSEVGTVTSLMKESHTSNQPKHRRLMVRVFHANRDQHDASRDANEVYPHLLQPEGMCIFVDYIANEATHWPSNDVEKAVHGRPSAGEGLTKFGEVLKIVSPENGVESKLAAK